MGFEFLTAMDRADIVVLISLSITTHKFTYVINRLLYGRQFRRLMQSKRANG